MPSFGSVMNAAAIEHAVEQVVQASPTRIRRAEAASRACVGSASASRRGRRGSGARARTSRARRRRGCPPAAPRRCGARRPDLRIRARAASGPRKAAPSSVPVAKLTRCGSSCARRAGVMSRKLEAASALSTPPSAVRATIEGEHVEERSTGSSGPGRGVARGLSAEPDQSRHPARAAVAAVREEALGLAAGAPAAAVDRLDTGARQRHARERIEIGLAAAARVARRRQQPTAASRATNAARTSAPTSKALRDRSPDPARPRAATVGRASAATVDSSTPAGEPAPTGVRDADPRRPAIGEHDRQAVGRQDCAHATGLERHGGIGARRACVATRRDAPPSCRAPARATAVPRAGRARRQCVDGSPPRRLAIADVARQIERGVGTLAHAAGAQVDGSAHASRESASRASSQPELSRSSRAACSRASAPASNARMSAGSGRCALERACRSPDAQARDARRAAPGAGTPAAPAQLLGRALRQARADRRRRGRRRADSPMCARCTRIWCVRPVSSLHAHVRVGAKARGSRGSESPPRGRPRARPCARDRVGWRSIGASIVPPPVMTPRTTASYSRSISRASSMRTSAVCAAKRARHDQQAARVLVEAVHDAGARQRGEPGVECEQRVLQGPIRIAGARMHDQPGRLVDHEQVLVVVRTISSGIAWAGVPASSAASRRTSPPRRPAPCPSGRRVEPSTWTSPDSIQLLSRLRE